MSEAAEGGRPTRGGPWRDAVLFVIVILLATACSVSAYAPSDATYLAEIEGLGWVGCEFGRIRTDLPSHRTTSVDGWTERRIPDRRARRIGAGTAIIVTGVVAIATGTALIHQATQGDTGPEGELHYGALSRLFGGTLLFASGSASVALGVPFLRNGTREPATFERLARNPTVWDAPPPSVCR